MNTKSCFNFSDVATENYNAIDLFQFFFLKTKIGFKIFLNKKSL